MPYERHVFSHFSPQAEKTTDKFMVSLRKQAQRCNFGESLEDSLCDQLIKKLPDMEWKQKLLEV